MKKLMCLCFAVFWIFISLILFLNYSIESFDNIFIDKTHITIKKDSDITNAEFISSIEKIMKSINEDVMYQTVEFDEASKNYLLYKTQNNNDFLNINVNNNTTMISNDEIISNTNAFSDNTIKLNIPNLIYNITISDFKNIEKYNLNNASYYISSDSEDIILETLSQNGYKVSIVNEISSSSVLSVVGLCLLPLFILCISIIIYTLSKPKETIIKKIDGFSNLNIIILNTLDTLKVFFIIFMIIEVLNFGIVELIYDGIFISYFSYSVSHIIISLVIIIAILILSNCIIFFQRNHNQFKGKSSKKELFALAITSKLVFSVFLIYTLSLICSNVYSIYTLYVSENNIINKIENYVTFPIHQISDSSNSEFNDESLERFYDNTVNTNNGVLIDSNNYRILSDNKSMAERFDQNFIIINENYLKLNPIHKPNGDIINNSDFDYNKFNILIPEKPYSDIKDVEIKMQNYGYENIEFNFIYYKADETILTFNTDIGTDNFGKIEKPLIWIFDKKYIDKFYYSEFFSNGYYFAETNSDDAYNQFLPLITDCGLDNIILETPLIKSNFSNSIATYYGTLIMNVIPGIIYFIGLIVLTVFICKLFCEMYKESIAHKKLNGFSFYSIYKSYLVLWSITSLIVLIISLVAHYTMNMNIQIIFISILIIIFELIIFNIVSKKYTRKIIFQILKGE